MREIKFRAWDGKRMTTSGIMFNTSTGQVEVPKEASFGGTMTTPYKLMQYTGLKDKNGVEIYEGDVVELYTQTHGNITGIIEWEQQACQYWIKWIQIGKERNINRYEPLQAFYGDTEQYVDTRVEVIGNIYQDK